MSSPQFGFSGGDDARQPSKPFLFGSLALPRRVPPGERPNADWDTIQPLIFPSWFITP